MAIRLPLKTVATFSDDNDTGTSSVSGGIPHTFQIPEDTDNVVLKYTASCVGTGLSVVLQTTDDGGTTYYDLAQTSIVSAAGNASAEWLSVPVNGAGVRTTCGSGSIPSIGGQAVASINGTIGTAESLTLGQKSVSGLPILSQQMRAQVVIDADVTSAASNSSDITVYVNSQSATA